MKKPLLIAYIAIGAVGVAAFAPLTVWASMGAKNYTEAEVIEAKLVLDENVRLEYLETEKLDTTGITFMYEDKTASMEELKITYNFDITGTRVVEFAKESGNRIYKALMPVHVYHVRHLDVRDCSIARKEDGTWDTSKLTVWAELNEPTNAFVRPEGLGDREKIIEMTEGQYSINVVQTAVEGVYQGNVIAGNATASFAYYDESTFNADRVLSFHNDSNNGEKLTLFCETSSNNFNDITYDEEVNVTGKYLYENILGKKRLFDFSYVKPAFSWDSHFRSNTLNSEIYDTYDNATEGVKVTIGETTFFASKSEWHYPILGMEEVEPTPEVIVDSSEINAEIVISPEAQLEYFVGEALNTTGLSFKVGEDTYDITETEVEYNFETSGDKPVLFRKNIGGIDYAAYIEVKVLKVMNFEFRNNTITKNPDGSFDHSKLVVWVELDGQSSRLEKAEDFPGAEQTTFVLTPDLYEVTVTASTTSGKYDCKVAVGAAYAKFSYYEEASFDAARILHLHNRNGNGDKLTLFVLYSSSNYVWGLHEITVTGEYLYERADGEKFVYAFHYFKENNSWASNFQSADYNNGRLVDEYGAIEDPEGFTATVQGVAFYSLSTEWHMPVLNF